ncbi:procathepsin L-like isoform X1 [Harmonia axyridis]|uniref:procathepsin L-like isoform X1 n=1 Tax=Harmonia axyridis TaxID=115357 RepID=UPI001E275AFE|nr:procathepsin L-like isoform X1 [Harmonia axyridis]
MKISVIGALCVLNFVFGEETFLNLDGKWDEFKKKFNKTYIGPHDTQKRQAWEDNLKKIHKHNEEAAKGLHSYTLKDNHLSDMSNPIYLQRMTKLTRSYHRKLPDSETVGDVYEHIHHLPEEVDWRAAGFKTPSFNQKDCGSCYAFSIAGVIQAQVFKETGKLITLSEQQIVDCSVKFGNFGCGGGSLRNTLRYLEHAGGLMTYDEYPYTAKQQKCKFHPQYAIVNTSSWAILPARDERALEAAIAKIGPVAASINASPHTFQLYHKGVYDDISCSSNTVNHAMLIVGYTKDAWILKNWWGSHWGENGYMKLRRRKNRCGVANYAAYALV